jgi:hypothetical protein
MRRRTRILPKRGDSRGGSDFIPAKIGCSFNGWLLLAAGESEIPFERLGDLARVPLKGCLLQFEHELVKSMSPSHRLGVTTNNPALARDSIAGRVAASKPICCTLTPLRGEGWLRPDRAANVVGNIVTSDDYRRRLTCGVAHTAADAGLVAAGDVAVAATDAGPVAAGGVARTAADAVFLFYSGPSYEQGHLDLLIRYSTSNK